MGLPSYLQRVRTLLLARTCVKCSLNGADQKLATSYFARCISLKQIERAIALGCCRKYVSWLNGADTQPVFSFQYFAEVVEEACDEETPVGHWDYLIPRLNKLESLWIEKRTQVPTR
jgi:hypothetical protein